MNLLFVMIITNILSYIKMSLQLFNRGALLAHLSSAVGFGAYFFVNDTNTIPGIDTSLRNHKMIVSLDTSGNALLDNGNLVYQYTSEQDSIVSIKQIQILIVSFFAITALFHGYYYIADGLVSHQYSEMIKNKNNYLRWIEYSISSTIMLYIIAFLSGTKDKNIYYLITATNVAIMAQGQLVEEAVRDGKPWWVPMCTGFVLLLAEFYVILRDFLRRQESESVAGFKQPIWVGSSLYIMFLAFASFGFISLYSSVSGTSYDSIEIMYIIASLIVKLWLSRYICLVTVV